LVEADRDVLAYERRHGDQVVRGALNLSHEERRAPFGGEVLTSTLTQRPLDGMLRADEGVILSPSPRA
jgi:alpha-glucosidase